MKWYNLVGGTAVLLLIAFGVGEAADKKASGMRGDSDGSGTLSSSELVAERKAFLVTLDENKDGKVSVDEFVSGLKKDFAARDTNKDGSLSLDEFVIYWCGKSSSPKTAATAGKASGEKGSMMNSMDANGNAAVDQKECIAFWGVQFGASDTNKDGKLTLDEFAATITKAAGNIDTNKDGVITVDEYAIFWTGAQKPGVPVKPAKN